MLALREAQDTCKTLNLTFWVTGMQLIFAQLDLFRKSLVLSSISMLTGEL
jgi:hypothetical protein